MRTAKIYNFNQFDCYLQNWRIIRKIEKKNHRSCSKNEICWAFLHPQFFSLISICIELHLEHRFGSLAFIIHWKELKKVDGFQIFFLFIIAFICHYLSFSRHTPNSCFNHIISIYYYYYYFVRFIFSTPSECNRFGKLIFIVRIYIYYTLILVNNSRSSIYCWQIFFYIFVFFMHSCM